MAILARAGVLERLRRDWRSDLSRSASRSEMELDRLRARGDEHRRELQVQLKDLKAQLREQSAGIAEQARQLVALQAQAAAGARELTEAVTALTRRLNVDQRIDARNEADEDWLARLPALLDGAAVGAHIDRAVSAADLRLDPFPHLVVTDILPLPVYELLVAALPGPDVLTTRDRRKVNIKLRSSERLPRLTRRAWTFFETAVVPVISDLLQQRFAPFVRQRFVDMFGSAVAAQVEQLPQGASVGRLMLRRPGYHLAPHLDPRRVSFTALLYLARPGDPEQMGTDLYSVSSVLRPGKTKTYYPEEDGLTCTLRAQVPFTPNTLLAFLNAGGAHGASMPKTLPRDTTRYAYQFYVGPDLDAFAELLRALPAETQRAWQDVIDRREE